MAHLMENTVLNVKNRSHTITAEVEIPEGGAEGVIVAQGGRFAGWTLYVKDGAAKYGYNWFDTDHYTIGGEKKLPSGTVNIRYHLNFESDAPGGGTGIYTVAIAWRGVTELTNPTASDCGEGSGLYGANDEFRRVLVVSAFVDAT